MGICALLYSERKHGMARTEVLSTGCAILIIDSNPEDIPLDSI